MNIIGNRNIIIAAYYFPPMGLAGTQRPLAMANYFQAYGYNVTVLTVDDKRYPIQDDSTVKTLHPDIKIHRCSFKNYAGKAAKILPRNVISKVKKSLPISLGKKHLFPDHLVGFTEQNIAELESLIKSNKNPILITSSPPVSIHKLGLLLRDKLDFKWIADFRDIWESLPYFQRSSEYKKLAEDYLRNITEHADLVSATSQHTLDHFHTKINKDSNCYFLPNGYQEEDFDISAQPSNGKIGLYGTINHLVGIERIFNWLSELNNKHAEINFRIKHTGYIDLSNFSSLLNKYDLSSQFESEGYLPHYDSIQSIRSNAVNLIALSDQYDTSYIIPSKLFELLRAEPPLVAVLSEGNAARELLSNSNLPNTFIINNKDQFIETISRLLLNRSDSTPLKQGVEQFARNNQLDKFSEIITKL